MKTTTVRISAKTLMLLNKMSKATGRSQVSLIEEAIEDLRHKEIFKETNAAYEKLKTDPEAWAEELKEREEFDYLSVPSKNK